MGSNKNNYDYINKLRKAATKKQHKIIGNILSENIEDIIENVNAQDKSGDTALMHAICFKYKEIAARILNNVKVKEKLNINLKGNNNNTILIFAAIYTPDLVAIIIQNYPGINPNARNLEGYTALMYASRKNHLDATKAILSCPTTQLDLVDNKKYMCTILLWAVSEGNQEIVQILVDYSLENAKTLNINAQNSLGNTALIVAANLAEDRTAASIAKACTIVKKLLEVPGIDLSLSSRDDQYTALMYIADYGNLEMLQAFLEVSGGNNVEPSIINAKDRYGRSALIYAAAKGDVAMCQELLNIQCIDVTAKDVDGQTVFHYAAKNGILDILKPFISILDLDIECSPQPLLFSASDKYIGNIQKFMIALQQRYCENSTYIDVINASSPTSKSKYLKISPEQAAKIHSLMEIRYQNCGGMCKPREMIAAKLKDKENLQNILQESLVFTDNTTPTQANKQDNKHKRKRYSYSQDYPSDDSQDSDYASVRRKKKYT